MDLAPLKSLFGDDGVSNKPDDLKQYGKDWTKHFTPNASAVVFPRSAEQVQKLVHWARKTKTALVPSGGRTGLSAAAFATQGELVVSFDKMNRILELNTLDNTLHCEAGAITEAVQDYAAARGLYFPVDFASRGSSQIGGNVATNAGGIKVIRYGLIRNWVAALQVVTGTGEILELNKSLVKNATGYDLRQLFIGSEGTLGFITEVTLNLTTPPKDLQVIVLGVPDLPAIMEVYKLFREALPLVAYEMFTELSLKYVTALGRAGRPFATECPFYVLIEVEKRDDADIETVMGVIEKATEMGLVLDGTLSQNDKQSKEFWSLRENITESTSHKHPYKNDISVRISKIPEFLNRMTSILDKDYPDFEVVWFGHIGDGNLHVNVMKPDALTKEQFLSRVHEVDRDMFELVKSHEGSISAEHGIGLLKRDWLGYSRTPDEIELMRQLKRVLDPRGLLNPGKVI